jgi:hypothetical protein
MELRRRLDVFQQFVQKFQILPCVLVKGYAQLLEEEVASYPDPSSIDVCAIAFTPLGGEGNQLSNLPLLLDRTAETETEWSRAPPEIVEGMVSLVPNYPPSGTSYSAAEVRQFVEVASFGQLIGHHEAFATSSLEGGSEVRIDAFPSLKAMTYTVFHKFYTDPNRKPSTSDAFDVLIAAALPYVEAVITENHLAEALRKTKRRDDFLVDLEVFTLRDFRDQGPTQSRKKS